jgi:hypothetical protein
MAQLGKLIGVICGVFIAAILLNKHLCSASSPEAANNALMQQISGTDVPGNTPNVTPPEASKPQYEFGEGLSTEERDACRTWIANALAFSTVTITSRGTQGVGFASPWKHANFGIICGKYGYASASYSDGPWMPKGFLQHFGLIASAVVPATPMKIEETAIACALKAKARANGEMVELRLPGGALQCTIDRAADFTVFPERDKRAAAKRRG